jgi:lipopolysaccharide transport system ATP-binding protein
MGDVAIRLEKLGKRYRLGLARPQYRTLREGIAGALTAPFRNSRKKTEPDTIWAIKDISFEVGRGEVVGIIGRNGAGKSTLLKILSRITDPTAGRAEIYGRVGSLLEVGVGFHPELTGRENVYLNGAILGMKRFEIERKFDEIVAFSEIAKFLDTPVKHYSSGMYVRLAFAVAAHLEPEILLVDEVLAVGDVAFQRKCLGKMGDVARGGQTVVFVSHNMAAIKSLCQRAILLDGGQQKMNGPVAEVVQTYLADGAQPTSEQVWADIKTAPGDDKTRLRAVRILDTDGRPITQAELESPFILEVEYEVLVPETVLNISFSLLSQEEIYVLASASITDSRWFQRPHPAGSFRSRCTIPGNFLNQGRYSFTVLLVENGRYIAAQLGKVVSIDMVDLGGTRAGYFGGWGGVVRPVLDWTTECLQTT